MKLCDVLYSDIGLYREGTNVIELKFGGYTARDFLFTSTLSTLTWIPLVEG